jgi:hypothetical protein
MSKTTQASEPALQNTKMKPDPDAANKKLARAFRDLESEIHDLKNMACLVSSALESSLGSDHSAVTGRPDFYYVPEQRRDPLMFAAYHLQSMIGAVSERYLAALEANSAKLPPSPQSTE